MAEIESLELKLSANTKQAATNIDKLIGSLESLGRSLNVSGIDTYSNSMSRLAENMVNLEFAINGIDSKKMSSVSHAFNSLATAGTNLSKLATSGENLGSSLQSINSTPLENISNALVQLGENIPDFSRIESLSKAVGKLGGSSASNASTILPQIARGIQSLNIQVPSLEGIDVLAQGLSRLGYKSVSNAATNLQPIANGLREIQGIQIDTSTVANLDSLGSALARFGYASSTQAIENIPRLAVAFNQMMTTLSHAPTVSQNVIDLANSMANLAAQGGRAGAAVSMLSPRISAFGNSCAKTSKKAFSLAATIGKIYAGYWLLFRVFSKLGQAIDLSSSLTEVQNVVDTVFGDMSDKLQDFSDKSIMSFGMSELSAKQFASRYQAMGSAMGITSQAVVSANEYLNGVLDETKRHIAGVEDSYADLGDSMADMSINLTKLAADMGSFYNMDYADVADDLSSIFTGMTRPLRQYGLDLTEATLKEWALKNGMDANIKSMTQAEKTMLRYQYVMANMGHVMNDYAITADTWANVTRTIGQQFQKLGTLIGTGFINAFKPALIRFRDFMNTLIDLVEKGLNAIGKLLGWQVEISRVGATMDDSMGDYADSVGDAAGKAKKLKDYLLGIDELNVLNPDDGSDGGGGGNATGGGGGASATASGADVEFKKFESDIASWFDLGRTISDKLADALKNIDWNSIHSKARNFGKNLAEFLNGLITPNLFSEVGKTIANALNTAIYAAVSFADTAKWDQFGRAIASGINGFFETFDFKELAHAINSWVKGILDMMIEAVDKVKWDQIGRKIGTFLAEIDFTGILKRVGKLIWKALNGAIDAYSAMFKTAPIETALLSLVGLTKLLRVAPLTDFGKAFGTLSRQADLFSIALRGGMTPLNALGVAMPTLGRGIDAVNSSMLAFDNSMMAGLSTTESLNVGLSTLSASIPLLAKGLLTVGSAFADFFLVKDAIYDISTGVGSLAGNIAELAAGVAVAGVAMTVVFGFPAGLIAAGVIGLIGAMKGLYDATSDLSENHAIATLTAEVDGLSFSLDDMTSILKNSVADIVGNLDELQTKASELATSKESIDSLTQSLDAMTGGLQYQSNVTTEEIDSIVQKINELNDAWKNSVTAQYDYAIEAAAADLAYLEQTGQATDDIRSQYEQRIGALLDEKNAALDAVDEKTKAFQSASDAYYDIISNENSSDAERQAALSEYTSALTSYYSEQKEAVGGAAGEIQASNDTIGSSLSDLAGQLDLSGIAIDDYDGLMSAFGDNMQVAGEVISNAQSDIQDEINTTNEALKTATGEMRPILEERLDVLNSQNDDLSEISSQYADILQEQYINKGKDIIQNGIDEYDTLGFMDKLGLAMFHNVSDAESYAQYQFQQYADNTILNEGGLADSLNKNLGIAEEEIWVDDFASNISDKLFDSSRYGDDTYVTGIKDNWVTLFDSAMGDTAKELEPKSTNIGKQIVGGIGEGLVAAVIPGADLVDLFDNVYAGIQAIFGIHSPAETMKPIGENIVKGIGEGFSLVDFASMLSEWWDTNVAPWFSLEKWSELGQGIYDGISQKWNEFKEWWNADGFLTWWEESVAPWFSYETWIEMVQSIYDAITEKWLETTEQWGIDIQSWWDTKVAPWFKIDKWRTTVKTIKDSIKETVDGMVEQWGIDINAWWNNYVSPWFTAEKWRSLLSNIAPAFKNAFKSAANNAIGALNKVIEGAESMVNRAIDALNSLLSAINPLLEKASMGAISLNISHVALPRIPTYARGGYIPAVNASSYSLFAAGENGIPEMLGTVGGRTAVAGGAEITGIKSAIEMSSERESLLIERLIEVEETLISVVEDKELTIGDEDIASANLRGQKLMGYQLRMA